MKKIVLFISVLTLILFAFEAKASHLAGGDIQYEYIGDVTGNQYEYEFTVRIYRDATGINLGGTVNMSYTSTCFANGSINLPLVAGTGNGNMAPNLDQCVQSSSPDFLPIEEWVYQGTRILNGPCQDWVFSVSLNARNGGITTLATSGNMYIESELNNLQAPGNNSPYFVSTPVRVFCVGNQLSFPQTTVEPDGDRISYSFATPKTGANAFVTFNAGYTASTPLSYDAAFGFNLDPLNGLISFIPTMNEVGVMAVLVEEERYDSVNNAWIKIGSVLRDMQINIASACNPAVFDGPKLDPTASGAGVDPISGHPFMTYSCLDSTVILRFDEDIICTSVDPTGADMRLTHPNGTPVPVLSLNPQNCNVDGTTRELRLKLHVPLSANGDYILYTKFGFDGNTLTNACGFGVPENDTTLLRVSGCFTAQQKIENVLIEVDNHPKVEFSPDLASFPNYLLDEYRFFRSTAIAGPYTRIGGKSPASAIDFDDLSLGPINVDQKQYFYYMSMIINGFEDINTITDTIGSILLTGFESSNTIDLNWTDYNGWGPGVIPNYSVFTSSDSGAIWTVVPAANGIAATSYTLAKPTDAGDFWISVRTTNPNSTNFTSISNWVGYNIPEPPAATPVVIPNVISPNSLDPENVKFTITNLEQYAERSLVIHNRWGKKVYESTNYTNEDAWDGRFQGSGDVVGDGVYFYELILLDGATNETKVFKGSVHVFTLN